MTTDIGETSSTPSDPSSDLTASNIFWCSGGRYRFILCLLLFAELLTAATAEAASELESADEPPPGTAIPAEWGLAMRIVVSDEWRMNSEKFVPNVTKKTSSLVYNSVMYTLSIYTENTGNHCILTPFSFLRGAAFAGGSLIS